MGKLCFFSPDCLRFFLASSKPMSQIYKEKTTKYHLRGNKVLRLKEKSPSFKKKNGGFFPPFSPFWDEKKRVVGFFTALPPFTSGLSKQSRRHRVSALLHRGLGGMGLGTPQTGSWGVVSVKFPKGDPTNQLSTNAFFEGTFVCC